MTPEEMRDRLNELGIESELVSYPNKKAIGVKWQIDGIVWKYDWYGSTPQALSTYMHYSPEQAIAATVGRSCASCPEMDNPDSYISHMQSALKWHDEHVPRPTNPRNTCVVLQGEKPPEEVLFVREDGGVTHYLPEVTCRNKGFIDDGEWYFVCSRCGCEFEYTDFACEFTEGHGLGSPKFCPNCRARVKEEAE